MTLRDFGGAFGFASGSSGASNVVCCVIGSISTRHRARFSSSLCRKALTRTTTRTLPPPSILESIGKVPSRDLSDGVEADERTTCWEGESGPGELAGISRASRAIVRNVSRASWYESRERSRRMCHIRVDRRSIHFCLLTCRVGRNAAVAGVRRGGQGRNGRGPGRSALRPNGTKLTKPSVCDDEDSFTRWREWLARDCL